MFRAELVSWCVCPTAGDLSAFHIVAVQLTVGRKQIKKSILISASIGFDPVSEAMLL